MDGGDELLMTEMGERPAAPVPPEGTVDKLTLSWRGVLVLGSAAWLFPLNCTVASWPLGPKKPPSIVMGPGRLPEPDVKLSGKELISPGRTGKICRDCGGSLIVLPGVLGSGISTKIWAVPAVARFEAFKRRRAIEAFAILSWLGSTWVGCGSDGPW